MPQLRSLLVLSAAVALLSVGLVASSGAHYLSSSAASATAFTGPVVFIKDRRGYVGVVFKLTKELPKSSAGPYSALAELNHVVNDRSVQHGKGFCYYSVLNFAPKWGRPGGVYELQLTLRRDRKIRRSGHLYKASTGYVINESTGILKDPHVTRRIHC